MDVSIIGVEARIPNITEAFVIKVNRSQVRYRVVTDSLGFLFFVISDMHMLDPTFSDVRFQKFNTTLSYSNPIYNVFYVKQIPTVVEFVVSTLEPGHDYESFFFIMNMNKIHNDNFTKLYFKTNGLFYLLFLFSLFYFHLRCSKTCIDDLKNFNK